MSDSSDGDGEKKRKQRLPYLSVIEAFDANYATHIVYWVFVQAGICCWNFKHNHTNRHVHGISCLEPSLLKNKSLASYIVSHAAENWCEQCIYDHNAVATKRVNKTTRESHTFLQVYLMMRERGADLGCLPMEVALMVHAYLLAPAFPKLIAGPLCGAH